MIINRAMCAFWCPISSQLIRLALIEKIRDHFLTGIATDSWSQKVEISPEMEHILMNYSWPGNVRELRNALQYGSVRATSEVITAADLPPNLISFENHKMHLKKKRRLKLTKTQVTEALKTAQGNRREAAKILGVSRSTLYRFFDSTEDSK
jgi:DNA-binding NtrC family response regulator